MRPRKIMALSAVTCVSTSQAVWGDECVMMDGMEPAQMPDGATCDTYVAAHGGTGVACHWSFDFRDPQATQFAGRMWQDIVYCHANAAQGTDDPVNHPDSYQVRLLDTARGRFALSVKDKGALGRTFVFLRREPSEP